MPDVLLIGWDGACWNRIHPLLDAGAMPNLARIVENGVMGDLATLTPLCSPLLWTSVATGQFADRHGVLDTAEPDPVTGGVRPVTTASLRAPQVWDVLAQQGVRSQAIGWPATHPAQAPATCVSDAFAHGMPNSVYPPALESTLMPLRFDPREWTGDELQLFVGDLQRIDQDKDKRLAQLAVILAEAVSVHAAATTLLENRQADFSAVWFGAIGRACALFPSGCDELYKDVVTGVYRFLDLLLGRLRDIAGPEAVVMLVSDRAAGEPPSPSSTASGARGMLCAAGPGIEPDELTFGAGLLDIVPTLLGLFGFAPPPGMVGRAIPEICPRVPSLALRNMPPPAPDAPPPSFNPDPLELEELGYTDMVAAARRPEAEAARARRDFHLAQVLLAQGRAGEAIPLLQTLAGENPNAVEFRLYLGHAYFQAAQYPQCRAICEALLAEFPDSPFAPLTWAHLAIAEGNYREARARLASGQEAYGMAAALDAAIGHAYLRIESWDDAAAAFRSAIRTDPGMAAAHEGLAHALLAAARPEEAAGAALDAIRLRYDLPTAHCILGTALQALGRDKEAAGAFAAGEMLRSRMPAA